MKQNSIIAIAAALILGTTTLTSCAASDHAGFYGAAAQPASANRIITITPDTNYVNVVQGDIVKFVAGDKAFTWNFDVTSKMWEMDLNQIAPPGTLNHTVKVYIEQNHIYDGGA